MYLVAPREKLNVFPESLDLPVIISRYTKYSKYTHSRHLRSKKHFKFLLVPQGHEFLLIIYSAKSFINATF